MPMNVFTDACLTQITGPVSIIKDQPSGLAGNLTVAGTATVSGALNASGLVTANSGLSVNGSLTGVSLTAVSQLTAATGISVTAGGITVTAGGISVAGGLQTDQLAGGCTSTAGVAITAAGTVSASTRVAKVSPTAAVTSCVMATGTTPGQQVTVLNEQGTAANAVSFAITSGASNLANAASTIVISGGQSKTFTWDPFTALWY